MKLNTLFMCLIFVIITSCLTSTKAKLNLYVNKDEVQTLLGMFYMFLQFIYQLLFIIIYFKSKQLILSLITFIFIAII
jgi:hypothetical protein